MPQRRKAATILKLLENIKLRKKDLEACERKLHEELQTVCTHPSIKRGGGGTWHSWPDYGTYPHWMKCNVCGLYGEYTGLDDKRLVNYEVLRAVGQGQGFIEAGAGPV